MWMRYLTAIPQTDKDDGVGSTTRDGSVGLTANGDNNVGSTTNGDGKDDCVDSTIESNETDSIGLIANGGEKEVFDRFNKGGTGNGCSLWKGMGSGVVWNSGQYGV